MVVLSAERVSRLARLVLGSLMLLPGALGFGLALWYPTLHTLALSLQAAPLGRPTMWAGLANYARLVADPAYRAAAGHGLLVALVRIAALALPAAAGWLWSRERGALRLSAGLALGLPLGLSAPVALALLWPLAARRVPWLTGLAFEGDQALPAYLGLECLASLGLGGTLTAAALLVAHSRRARWGTLGLAALLAASSGLDSFTLPFVATGGGPHGATLTPALSTFRTAFLGLQLGQAAAQASVLLAACLGLGLAFAFAGERLGLCLAPITVRSAGLHLDPAGYEPPKPERNESEPSGILCGLGSARARRAVGALRGALARAAEVTALALLVVPFLLVYAWSAGLACYPVGQPLARAMGELLPGLALINGTLAPLLTTLVVGLPAAYLAALSLSLVRPFGARGSRLAAMALVASGFVPPVVVGIGILGAVRAAGLYGSPPAAGLPFVACPAAFYVLKLYFDGQAPLIDKAHDAGQPTAAAFIELAFRPSLAVAAIAGAAALLLQGQSLLWPLLILAQRDYFPLSLRLAVLQNALAPEPAALGAGCWLVLTAWGSAVLLAWGPLQAWALQRFRVICTRGGSLL